MTQTRRVVAAVACLLIGLGALGSAASAADTTVNVADTADTFTTPGKPTTNYGTSQTLGVYATPAQTAVLRFVIPAAPSGQALTAARLRVRTGTIASAGSANAINVRTASNSWTETGTTYNTRPTVGTTNLGTLPGGTVPNTAYAISLTPGALAPGSTTLALQGTGSDSFWIWSREAPSTANRPVLELTYSPTTPPPPADTTAPTTPTDLAANVTGASVGLSWTASTDAVGVTGYRVHRSDTAGFTPSATTLVATVASPGYTDQNRPPGTWYYRVIATDLAGNTSDASDAATALVEPPPPDETAPTTPAGLTATVTGASVALSWTASTDAVGVTGYQVHRSDTAGFTPSGATLLTTVTSPGHTDQSPPAGTWYYRVVATDLAGNASDPSDGASAVVPPVDPTPTNVSVATTADTFTTSSKPTTNYGTGQTLGVYSSPVQTALIRFVIPAAPSGKALTGARLRIRTDAIASAGTPSVVNVRTAADNWTETGTTYNTRPTLGASVIGTLPGGTVPSTAYSITLDPAALSSGSSTLAVQGTSTDSFWFWSRNAPVVANRPVLDLTFTATGPPPPPDTEAPTAPADLTATVTGSSVKLDWPASTDDRGVTGYVVHRSADAVFTPSTDTAIGTVTGTTKTDTARPQGTWHYLVVARDAAGNTSTPSPIADAEVTAVPDPTTTVVAAGDLVCPPGTTVTTATCKHVEVRELADAQSPTRFIMTGDLAQGMGSYEEFTAPGRFADTFGDLGSKILPVVGNHEGYTAQATGYWNYFYGFGVNTGPYGERPTGWYTQMINSNWRFIGLNSECDTNGLAGGCGVGSPQYQWLKNLLESDNTPCTVVAYHKPRWTTGSGHPPYVAMAPMWDLMAANGVDIALSGHNHIAESFKPIGVSGTAAQPVLNPQGIRPFTVGIGGASQAGLAAANTGQFSALQARARGTFGVLKLSLRSDGYDWGFLPIAGKTFVNSGTTGSFTGTSSCH